MLLSLVSFKIFELFAKHTKLYKFDAYNCDRILLDFTKIKKINNKNQPHTKIDFVFDIALALTQILKHTINWFCHKENWNVQAKKKKKNCNIKKL